MTTDEPAPSLDSFRTGTPCVRDGGVPVRKPPFGPRPLPTIPPYEQGLICTALAMGLSEHEVIAWIGFTEPAIRRLVQSDPQFRKELALATDLAIVHPLLRIQQAAGKSWRAAQWLNEYLASRHGKLPVGELLAEFSKMTRRIREELFEFEVRAEKDARRVRT